MTNLTVSNTVLLENTLRVIGKSIFSDVSSNNLSVDTILLSIKIGINKLSAEEALDVNGNIMFSGNKIVVNQSISEGSFLMVKQGGTDMEFVTSDPNGDITFNSTVSGSGISTIIINDDKVLTKKILMQ